LYGYVDDSCACPYDMSRNGASLGGHTPRRCLQTSASSMLKRARGYLIVSRESPAAPARTPAARRS